MSDLSDKLKQENKALKLRLEIAMKTIENLRLILELQKQQQGFKDVKEGLTNG